MNFNKRYSFKTQPFYMPLLKLPKGKLSRFEDMVYVIKSKIPINFAIFRLSTYQKLFIMVSLSAYASV